MSSTAQAVAHAERDERRRGQIAIALAAVAWSSAGVLQRGLSMDVATQLAGRALFAMLALLVFTMASHRGALLAPFRAMGIAGLAVAACMAVASGSFIVALNHTSVAHVLFIQATAPIMAALLAWLALGERVSPRTVLALVIAMGGVAVMIGDPRGGTPLGDGISLLMSFAFAVAIVITRARSDISMAPATCLSQMFILVLAVPFASLAEVGGGDLVLLVAIGVGQMGLGLALFTVGARLIPAAEAALITLLEVVLGPLWVWLAVSERPDTATLAGGAIVIVAVVVQALGERPVRPIQP